MMSINAFPKTALPAFNANKHQASAAGTAGLNTVRFSGVGTPVRIQNVKEAAALLKHLLYEARVSASDVNRAAREEVRKQAEAKAEGPIDKFLTQADPVGDAHRDTRFMRETYNHFDGFKSIITTLAAKTDKTPVEEQAVLLGKFIIANENAHYTDVNPDTFLADGGKPGVQYNHFVFKDQSPNYEFHPMYTRTNPGVNFYELLRAIAKNNEINATTIQAYNEETKATLQTNMQD